ncbi:MAG: CRISPR-associated endonuclease Cas2 [Caldilineaceae bacterium SB0662_bin_25]|nr:CRISPR-associated endonuclease Cas2 [Caldilineaceae bacterium SB0662_bin_25]
MRNRYIVAYDISDGKRLRRIFKKMHGFGDALQYSVFACDLSPKERVIMEEALTEIMNLKEDRVIIIDVGPVEGRGGEVMRTLGRQTKPRQREALVV